MYKYLLQIIFIYSSLSLSQAPTADAQNQLRCDYWERSCPTLCPSQNITLSIKCVISQCDVCYQLGTGNYRLPCGVCCCTECLRVCITENFRQLEKIRPTFASNADRLLWCPCVGNCDKQMIPSLVDGKTLITRALCVSIYRLCYQSWCALSPSLVPKLNPITAVLAGVCGLCGKSNGKLNGVGCSHNHKFCLACLSGSIQRQITEKQLVNIHMHTVMIPTQICDQSAKVLS